VAGIPLNQVLAEAAKLSSLQFVAAYPHFWLLVEALKQAQPRGMVFDTIAPGAQMTAGALSQAMLRILDGDVRANPQRYELYPVLKTPRNPWTDRVLIGRAPNNDVVLDNPSVSKVHAYISQQGSSAQIASYETRNPTKVGATTVLPNGPSVGLPDGADLQIGLLRARYLSTTALYRVLRGS
jgi:pSer/pThr/pTyr-binding forkhead associated (FHA) protein